MEEKIDPNLQAILSSKEKDRAHLIEILQEVQNEFGYLSKENLYKIGKYLDISPNEVYGVASFYKQFKFIPSGKHVITVCMGTACFIKGGKILSETVKTTLKIDPDQTTPDGLFSFERVACLGCCALAPVVQIDGEVHGLMTPAKLLRIINKIRREEKER